MTIYAKISRFYLTFLRKVAQILSGGLMNLYNLNIKKGKLNMNKNQEMQPKHDIQRYGSRKGERAGGCCC